MQRQRDMACGSSDEKGSAVPEFATQNAAQDPSAGSKMQTYNKSDAKQGEKSSSAEDGHISFTTHDSSIADNASKERNAGRGGHDVEQGIESLLQDIRNEIGHTHHATPSSAEGIQNGRSGSPTSDNDFETMRQFSSFEPGSQQCATESKLHESHTISQECDDHVKCEQDNTQDPRLFELSLTHGDRHTTPNHPGGHTVKLDTTPWGIPIAPAPYEEPASVLTSHDATDPVITSLQNDIHTMETMSNRHSLPVSSSRNEGTAKGDNPRRHSSFRPTVRFTPTAEQGTIHSKTPRPTAPSSRISIALPHNQAEHDLNPGTEVSPMTQTVYYGERREASVGQTRTQAPRLRTGRSLLSMLRIFSNRPEQWGAGVHAGLLYTPETEHDGQGTIGLRSTLLAGMSAQNAPELLVRRGEKFTMRIVGTHLPRRRRGVARVAYSAARAKGFENGVVDTVKTVHTGYGGEDTGKGGYRAVPWGDSLVATGSGEVREIAARFVVAEMTRGVTGSDDSVETVEMAVRSSGRRAVDSEIVWEIAAEGVDGLRRAALRLRYGYYFVLAEPCEARLYCAAVTPEHLRLVALAGHGGGSRREVYGVGRMLEYVVVRVSEA